MHLDISVLWTAALTFLVAPLAYFLRSSLDRLRALESCVSHTREQLAEKYATKSDLHRDMERVLARLEMLDQKLDKVLLSNSRIKGMDQ